MYTMGAIHNVLQIRKYYPGWIARYYVEEGYATNITDILHSLGGEIAFIPKSLSSRITGLFWRFLAAEDPEVQIMVCRDTDCRLSKREALAVKEWLESGLPFHIMRDHPWHNFPIMGGMWGCRYPALANIRRMLLNYGVESHKGADQEFLARIVYPKAKNQAFVHDEFFNSCPFPEPRQNLEFVGQPFYADDSTDPINLDILRASLIQQKAL